MYSVGAMNNNTKTTKIKNYNQHYDSEFMTEFSC